MGSSKATLQPALQTPIDNHWCEWAVWNPSGNYGWPVVPWEHFTQRRRCEELFKMHPQLRLACWAMLVVTDENRVLCAPHVTMTAQLSHTCNHGHDSSVVWRLLVVGRRYMQIVLVVVNIDTWRCFSFLISIFFLHLAFLSLAPLPSDSHHVFLYHFFLTTFIYSIYRAAYTFICYDRKGH